MTKSDATVVLV